MTINDKFDGKTIWATLLSKGRSFLPVRDRHLFTRKGHLRLRYLALPLLAVGAATALALVGFSTGTQAHYGPASVGMAHDVAFHSDEGRQKKNLRAEAPAAVVVPEVIPPRFEHVKIGKGDTLGGALQRAGLSSGESYRMIQAMETLFDPRKVKPGQEIAVRFDPVESAGQGAGGEGFDFAALRMALDPLETLVVTSDDAGHLAAEIEKTPVETKLYAKKAAIDVSLYGSAAKAGIPVGVIADAIHVYSWDVDFQRDIRHGDQIELLYEQIETPEGAIVKTGNILYARLVVNGREVPVYRFENSRGDVDYYTPEGRSIRKALMKTPVDGARISSGFGMRKHPVLGYSKMHKGLDFAAPTGTPIYAAGDGVIEKAGPFSSFGNYVRIRHNSGLKTAYAHMQYIKKGIRPGVRVKQGQVIGAIGTTGRSTGPHLHYEVHVNGKQVNPRTYKTPHGESLTGTELATFKQEVGQFNQQYAALLDTQGDAPYDVAQVNP